MDRLELVRQIRHLADDARRIARTPPFLFACAATHDAWLLHERTARLADLLAKEGVSDKLIIDSKEYRDIT